MKATKPLCPRCGSDNIRSIDRVLVTNSITGWDVDEVNRVFAPSDYAGGEVCWDSSEFVEYDCGNCGHVLVEADLSIDREVDDDDEDDGPIIRGDVMQRVARYNNRLNELEIAPNGDDYNNLLDLLAGGEYRDPSKVSR